MSLISVLGRYVQMFPKPPVHRDFEEKEIERRIVARYGQGNISLQLGRYSTREGIEKRKRKIISHKFLK